MRARGGSTSSDPNGSSEDRKHQCENEDFVAEQIEFHEELNEVPLIDWFLGAPPHRGPQRRFRAVFPPLQSHKLGQQSYGHANAWRRGALPPYPVDEEGFDASRGFRNFHGMRSHFSDVKMRHLIETALECWLINVIAALL